MNAIDETTTKTIASRRLIAPRGSSRMAVRGFFASYCASTSRLNPIAALRAATIAMTIHSTRHATSARPEDAVQRQQRTGQRERQREDGVAEPYER